MQFVGLRNQFTVEYIFFLSYIFKPCRRIGSDYVTDKFDREGARAFELRTDNKQVDPREYVCLITDVLRMQKNIVLARHFHYFSKSEIR